MSDHDPAGLLAVLDEVAAAVADSLVGLTDWGLAGTRDGQYRSDLAADAAVAEVLDPLGLGVLSEESGLRRPDADLIVIVDPVDGSTNAAQGIPWYATSLCVVDARGPLAALVVNLATGERFEAIRGGGARRNGEPVAPRVTVDFDRAIVGLSGYPPHYLGWRQYRALGAAALDLCSVACGRLDGYLDCSWNAHGVWDYAAALLVCSEAGAPVVDLEGRDLIVLEHEARRTPIAAATPELLEQLVAARLSFATPADHR